MRFTKTAGDVAYSLLPLAGNFCYFYISSKAKLMRNPYLALLVCCLLFTATSYAQQKKNNTIPSKDIVEIVEEEEVYFIIQETIPEFYGNSDLSEFEKWVSKQIPYPAIAQDNNIQGRTTLRFTVDKNGNVNDVKVVRSVDPSLDKEALRVIKSSPKWKPAMQNGLSVPYTLDISVNFKLQ